MQYFLLDWTGKHKKTDVEEFIATYYKVAIALLNHCQRPIWMKILFWSVGSFDYIVFGKGMERL